MPVIKLHHNEYDLTNASELREQLNQLVDEDSLTLDLSNVTYLDSLGLRELLVFHKARLGAGRGLVSVILSPQLRRLFEASGLGTLFITATAETAIHSQSEKPSPE